MFHRFDGCSRLVRGSSRVPAFINPLVAFVTLVGTSLAVPGILFNIGWLTDLSAFILSPNGTFAFGLLIVAIFALITVVGWRAMKPLFYAAWISEVIGIIVMWGLLGTANPDSFARLWDASSLGKALPYGQVLPTAVSNGFNTMQNSWEMTLACLPLASLFFFGYYYQTIVTFMGPSIAAMLIPYVRRNLFETLPPVVRYKIGGVPAISIVGAICTISFAYLSYLYYVTPQITSAGIYGTVLMVGAFVLGIAIYLGSRAYWRSIGIAVDLAFKELPPD